MGMEHEFCDIPSCFHVQEPETSWSGLCPGCLAELRAAFSSSELEFEDSWAEVLLFIFEEELHKEELWAERGLFRFEE